MFEIVRAIHEALHTESTLAFVFVVVLVFGSLSGGAAYLVDRGYKNSRIEKKFETERHLTADQLLNLSKAATGFPKEAFLYVRIPTNDVEAQNYGKEIWSAFEGKVSGSLVYTSGPVLPGIQLASGSVSEKDAGYAGTLAIAGSFTRLGIPYDQSGEYTIRGSPISLDQTFLIVGPNPQISN